LAVEENESDPGESIHFTDSQRRHVSLMIRRLVIETREWIEEWDRNGFSSREAKAFRRTLDAVLERARRAAAQLSIDLPESTVDPERRLSVWASAWWSTVLNSRPEALRAYGEVDESVPALIGPIVEDLARLLMRLATLTHGVPHDETDVV
jgi:hypothetical protein